MLHRWPSPLYAPPGEGGSAAPAAGGAPPSPQPPGDGGGAPPVRPDWVPETYWDPKAGLKSEDFGKHFAELSTFHKTETEKRATVPQSPDGYKVEAVDIKLPDTVKVPAGEDGKPLSFKVNPDDPRIPMVRAFAHQFGLPQEAVNALVLAGAQHDAQSQINAINAAHATIEAEQKKLGAKFPERKTAVESFLKGAFTGDEVAKNAKYDALYPIIGNAAAFEAIEDLIARAVATGVPNKLGDPPPLKPAEKPLELKMFPGRFGPDGKLKTG